MLKVNMKKGSFHGEAQGSGNCVGGEGGEQLIWHSRRCIRRIDAWRCDKSRAGLEFAWDVQAARAAFATMMTIPCFRLGYTMSRR